MNPSRIFIERPIATLLIMIAIVIAGWIAYTLLPIASLPNVDYPTMRVVTTYPGASPDVVTSHISAPLEKQFGQMAGLNQMTSSNSLGLSLITLQFDSSLSLDVAEQEVQASINAATTYLPDDLPYPPIYNKVNPADVPIMTFGLTSTTLPLPQVEDLTDTALAPKLSQLSGVGLVTLSGGARPAVRIDVNPMELAQRGLSFENVRTTVNNWNVNAAQGSFDGPQLSYTIKANDQLFTAADYRRIILAYQNNAPLRLQDVATVTDGAENAEIGAWMNETPAIIVDIQRQPGANVISVADHVKAVLPKLMSALPSSVSIKILNDRTDIIRASVRDVKFELLLSIALVVMVIFIFLRNLPATFIPSITVPVSLIGSFGFMYLLGFSVNNLTLMALTIATGFVVDDAIVMIENIARHLDMGKTPLQAALDGSKQIAFTIISLTISLIAVLIPLLFMQDVIGRLFQEFASTVAITILISAFVSLTLTPMLCSRLLKREVEENQKHGRMGHFEQKAKEYFDRVLEFYDHSLQWVLLRQSLILKVALATVVMTGLFFYVIPKDFFPAQDTGLIQATTEASPAISFQAMTALQSAITEKIKQDPAVANVVSYVGIDGTNTTLNNGRLLIVLKADGLRENAFRVIKRLQKKTAGLPGMAVFFQSVPDVTLDDKISHSQYQFNVSSPDLWDVNQWTQTIIQQLKAIPILQDVAMDGAATGLAQNIVFDRDTGARLGISAEAFDNALYNAFGQRQISTIYTQTNQYRVVLDASSGLENIYLNSATAQPVPLATVTKITPGTTPLVITRQNQFPVATISFNVNKNIGLSEAVSTVNEAVSRLAIPMRIETGFEGAAKAFEQALQNEVWLLIAAVFCVYIVLGVLYESFIHPVTILSTLPSATLGALCGLYLTGAGLNIISLIGIVLLIGIVMKNAIMMIDFALDMERKENKSAEEAIYQACLLRFRPILMTTMAAMFGAIPLAIGAGVGSELRQPLGIAIVGGLIVSQLITLYTTPVIYIFFAKHFARSRDAL